MKAFSGYGSLSSQSAMKSSALIVLWILPSLSGAICPVGTIQGVGRRACYLTYPKELSWPDAEDFCRLNNGQLTSIPNAELDQKLARILGSGSYWLGATKDVATVDTRASRLTGWKWLDGSPWVNSDWACGR